MAIPLDDQLCFAVYRAAHAFTRAYKPLLDRLGLTYPQYLAMLALWEEDGQAVKDLGRRLGLDSGTLSPLLKRLEQAGFVVRQRDAGDERQVIVSLTAEGLALAGPAEAVYAGIGAATGCSAGEAAELRTALLALTARLSGEEAPAG